ncbi:MAG: hypothetical protein K2M07_01380 [Muribaculaceae bacterium]|nr:hypothetical protein [Muribaculaceae bacterium]
MRYFITVTLSQHNVTLKYYRDDDGINRLLPFQGAQWPAPLAIHVADNGIIVGKDALDRFEVSQPNTFYNLFSLIDSGDTYNRFGLHKNTSHLIYLAVDTLLDQVLPAQLGVTLGETRRNIPLAFNFTPDVGAAERQHVIDIFTKGDGDDCGGYSNIGIIDADSQLARLALQSNHRNYAMVLHTSARNLTVTLYARENPSKCIGSGVMKDLGIDRRIMNGVNEIKEYVRYKNPNIDFSPIEARLEKIVEDFVASGKMELNSKVMINGENYRFSLSVDDLRTNAVANERYFIAQHLRQFLHNHSVHPDDTVMVLASPKLQNDYFLPMFREHFESVYCVTPQQYEQMQQKIIDKIVGSDYNFSEEENMLRSLREKLAQMSAYVRNMQLPAGQFDAAIEDISDFLKSVSEVSLPSGKDKLIADATHLLDQARELQATARTRQPDSSGRDTHSAGARSGVSTPPDYFSQLADSVTEEINQFVEYGDLQAARNSYNELLGELRRSGKEQEYAGRLRQLKDLCYPAQHRQPPVTESPRAQSPLRAAISRRDFRQARKICKENDDFDNYQRMKELEDACKKYAVAEKFFSQYVAEHNSHAIERAIRELNDYSLLLSQVGEAHPEVDQLLDKYKQVK